MGIANRGEGWPGRWSIRITHFPAQKADGGGAFRGPSRPSDRLTERSRLVAGLVPLVSLSRSLFFSLALSKRLPGHKLLLAGWPAGSSSLSLFVYAWCFLCVLSTERNGDASC